MLGRFFQNKVGFQSNHLARATINQIVMKKAKSFIFHKLEIFVLKSGKNENQQFPGNPPNIENLFASKRILLLVNALSYDCLVTWIKGFPKA